MITLREEAWNIYHICETHGEIVDKIERALMLEAQNAALMDIARRMVALESSDGGRSFPSKDDIEAARAAIEAKQ